MPGMKLKVMGGLQQAAIMDKLNFCIRNNEPLATALKSQHSLVYFYSLNPHNINSFHADFEPFFLLDMGD